MKLFATDDQSELEILHKGDENYSSFTCRAKVLGPCAEFEATNYDLYFLDREDFIEKFQLFIDGNTDSVKLEGTYDTEIIFSRKERNTTMVNFCMGIQSIAYVEAVKHKLTGAFQVRTESQNAYKREFVELFGQSA